MDVKLNPAAALLNLYTIGCIDRLVTVKMFKKITFKQNSLDDLINNNIIIIWFGDTVTVSHSTKCDTNSKVRALS